MHYGITTLDSATRIQRYVIAELGSALRFPFITRKHPATTIAVSELADSSVNFVLRPWVNTADYWGVMFDLTETIKKRFDKEGISFPYPQQDVHVHNVSSD